MVLVISISIPVIFILFAHCDKLHASCCHLIFYNGLIKWEYCEIDKLIMWCDVINSCFLLLFLIIFHYYFSLFFTLFYTFLFSFSLIAACGRICRQWQRKRGKRIDVSAGQQNWSQKKYFWCVSVRKESVAYSYSYVLTFV